MKRALSVVLLLLCLCAVGESAVLRDLAQRKNLLIGSCSAQAHFSDTNYTTILGAQFSVVTPENEMKWQATEPSRNQFTYSQGDAIVAMAEKFNQKVRGHNLCWGVYNPAWLTNGGFSPSTKQDILKNHIANVMNHFKGKVIAWDVVNEAVSDNPNGNNIFKQNVWYPDVPNYVDLAFQWASQIDSSVKLFYNDYSAEGLGAKSDAIYNMVKGMKQRNIPIHGVGLQFHVSLGYCPSVNDIESNIKRLTDLGLQVHITELDVSTDGGSGSDAQKLAAQATVYGNILKACLGNKMCTSFETWGFTDRYTWLGSDKEPLLYDTNYLPKPAYTQLVNVLSA